MHLVSGAGKIGARCEMMASILREIMPAKDEKDKFEPDATAHYNWIMGDTNFRFKCTY